MSRIAYVNGRYLPHRDAKVHIEDRGYQFADGVYEVCEVRGGRLVDERRHMARLERSLANCASPMPMSPRRSAWCCTRRWRRTGSATASSICRSPAGSRGAISLFPAADLRRPRRDRAPLNHGPQRGARGRGHRGHHGAGQSLGPRRHQDSRAAAECAGAAGRARAGAREAWFVDKDGVVTEAASANAWIVTRAGKLVTRHADQAILRGITRTVCSISSRRRG